MFLSDKMYVIIIVDVVLQIIKRRRIKEWL